MELADSIIAEHFTFRGSLGVTVEGLAGFKGYVAQVRAAFPDFHNRIEELIAEGGKVAARLTYSGTRRGEVFGISPTGRRIKYAGVALFRLEEEKLLDGWVLGDTRGLMKQLTEN